MLPPRFHFLWAKIAFCILRKDINKNCPVALSENQNRSITARLTLASTGDTLLDQVTAKDCTCESSLNLSNCSDQDCIAYLKVAGIVIKTLRHVNSRDAHGEILPHSV